MLPKGKEFEMLFKLRYVISLLVILIIAVIILSMSDKISPKSLTITAITEICVRANLYTEKYGHPPFSLKDLPIRKGYANMTKDGWGLEFTYNYDQKNGTVSMVSRGENKVLGDRDDIFLSVKLDANNMIPIMDMANCLEKYHTK
jgi:hypothetical protein